ncbi:hypothetical protein NUW54_g9594 [Trametes sanguinea]|uniref:Uncharacterized protein n=1 Tax=Trametes sanguinea TaxID=158606 RepID=A0ACC1P612_9APHY|nr:hypothetical protein NUW54_g9594 [Trametes sanguinea]
MYLPTQDRTPTGVIDAFERERTAAATAAFVPQPEEIKDGAPTATRPTEIRPVLCRARSRKWHDELATARDKPGAAG